MRWLRSSAWLGIVAVACIAIGILAAAIQRAGFSPILILSLLLGTAAGTVAIGVARFLAIGNRRVLIVGAVLGSLGLILSQHYALYRAYVNGWEQKRSEKPELALFRDPPPQDFHVYLRQESADGRIWLWLLDVILVTAAAVTAVTWWRGRTHFCDPCGRWLEFRWRGPPYAVDAPPAVKAACTSACTNAQNALATLLICPQGCGTAVVELTWEAGGTTQCQTIESPS